MSNEYDPSQDSTQKTGKTMAMIAWVIGIALMTQLFGMWEEHQINPNQNVQSYNSGQKLEVALNVNRQGHYRFLGEINNSEADFLVDTGATDVVIPAALGDFYALESTGQGFAMTANGYVELEKTIIPSLSIGDIKLYNVRASLNPAMTKDQPILLGMSALGQLDIEQSQGKMVLKQY